MTSHLTHQSVALQRGVWQSTLDKVSQPAILVKSQAGTKPSLRPRSTTSESPRRSRFCRRSQQSIAPPAPFACTAPSNSDRPCPLRSRSCSRQQDNHRAGGFSRAGELWLCRNIECNVEHSLGSTLLGHPLVTKEISPKSCHLQIRSRILFPSRPSSMGRPWLLLRRKQASSHRSRTLQKEARQGRERGQRRVAKQEAPGRHCQQSPPLRKPQLALAHHVGMCPYPLLLGSEWVLESADSRQSSPSSATPTAAGW